MNNIFMIGTRDKIIKNISESIDIDNKDAISIFEFLKKNCPQGSSLFGSIMVNTPFSESLVYGEGQYYINVSKSLLIAIAFFLDLNFTNGALAALCGMIGIDTQVFYKLNQNNGEVCLLREFLKKDSLKIGKGLIPCTRECINNDLACRYRDYKGICCMTENGIKNIIDLFKEIKIIK